VVDAATKGLILQLISSRGAGSVVMSATMKRKLYHVDPVVAAAGEELGSGEVVSRECRESSGESVPPARSVARVRFTPAVPSVPSARSVARVLFTPTVPSEASQESSKVDSSEAPYTFAVNRSQILGSYGTERVGFTAGPNPLQRLHLRCGHAPKAVLLAGLKANAYRGALITYEACKKLEVGACDACISSTMRQETVRPSSRDLSKLKPIEEVGLDPVQLSTTAFGGENYVNIGLCYGSKVAMAYAEKTEGNQTVKRDWCLPYGHTMRILHTDFGSVFQSKAVQDYLLEEGISHDCSSPNQHSHNLVEGACIRVLVNRARKLLADSGLPPRFAVFAIQAAIQSWNAMLHPATASSTPLEQVTGVQNDISALRPFRAPVYYFNTKEERKTSDDPRWKERASKGVLLGCSKLVKGGYLIYPGKNRAILHS
jgi:hypothetical protein